MATLNENNHPVNVAAILAKSLDNEIRAAKVISRINKVLADDGNHDLKVLKHGDAAKAVMDLYTNWISDRDFTSFVKFMKQIDELIYKFRGNQDVSLEDLDNEDGEGHHTRHKRHKRRGRGSPVKTTHTKTSKPSSKESDEADDESSKQPADHSVVISEILGRVKERAKRR